MSPNKAAAPTQSFMVFHSPIGPLFLGENGQALTHLVFSRQELPADYTEQETPLLRQASQELTGYFAGTQKAFSLPLAPAGTPFQQKVWEALRTIPYGETRSYGEIARLIGQPKACRAVGSANHHNPISIIIPCHRVIGANGSLTGYGGVLPKKTALLELEKGHNSQK